MCQYPTYDPESQTLLNYLELMKASFIATNVFQEERQVGIILSHIPKTYFDSLVALSASFPVSDLSLADLEIKLEFLYDKPRASWLVSMMAFYDGKKLGSESYSHFYKDFNFLAEQCALNNKSEFIKLKIFMEARKEKYFYEKLANFICEAQYLEELLFILQNSENDERKDSSIENPSANMLNKFSKSGNIHHVAVLPDVSSLGGNILNHFSNSEDFHHAAVPPNVSSLSGHSFPKMMRETSSDGQKGP